MGMSINSSNNAWATQGQSYGVWHQRRTGLNNVLSSLQSGDLTNDAGKALADFMQSLFAAMQTSQSTGSASTVLTQPTSSASNSSSVPTATADVPNATSATTMTLPPQSVSQSTTDSAQIT